MFQVRYFVCASPVFWQQHGRLQSPKDLRGLPALTYSGGRGTNFWQFKDAAGKPIKVPMTPRIVANQGAYLIEAVKAGLGVALEPVFVCGEALQAGDLESVLDEYESYERIVKIVRPSSRPPSLRVQRFLDALKTGLSGRQAEV